jgi:hypothetical protein
MARNINAKRTVTVFLEDQNDGKVVVIQLRESSKELRAEFHQALSKLYSYSDAEVYGMKAVTTLADKYRSTLDFVITSDGTDIGTYIRVQNYIETFNGTSYVTTVSKRLYKILAAVYASRAQIADKMLEQSLDNGEWEKTIEQHFAHVTPYEI